MDAKMMNFHLPEESPVIEHVRHYTPEDGVWYSVNIHREFNIDDQIRAALLCGNAQMWAIYEHFGDYL